MLLYTQVKSAIMEIFKSCKPLKDFHVKIYKLMIIFEYDTKKK